MLMRAFHSNGRIAAVRKTTQGAAGQDGRSTYVRDMARLLPILLFSFLALFAVSNVARAVSANCMASQMVMADGDAMAMANCQACAGDGEGSSTAALCNLDCTAPAVVSLVTIVSFDRAVPADRHDRPLSMVVPHGLRAPPDPFPPRSLI